MDVFHLEPNDFSLPSSAYVTWHVFANMDVSIEKLLKPEAWAHFAMRLKPGDYIVVTRVDNVFIGEFRVLQADNLWAKVEVMRLPLAKNEEKVDLPPSATENYSIEWRGRGKHSVVRKSDNVVVQSGMDSRLDAEIWLKQHLKALAA